MALDELSSQARTLLAVYAAADDPSTEDRARIDAKFERTLSASGIAIPLAQSVFASQAAATTAGGAMRASRSLFGSKLIMASLLGAGLVAAGLTSQLQRAPTTADLAARERQLPANAVPEARPPVAKPIAEAPAANTEVTSPTAARLAPVRVVAIKAARSSAPQAELGSRATPVSPPRPGSTDSLDSEVGLLRSATDALRLGRYARAMSLLELHATRFPEGALGEERAGLRVLALCGLGKTGPGLEERERFLRASPRSVLADRVRAACLTAEHVTPRADP
jgi:hypothetical protein